MNPYYRVVIAAAVVGLGGTGTWYAKTLLDTTNQPQASQVSTQTTDQIRVGKTNLDTSDL